MADTGVAIQRTKGPTSLKIVEPEQLFGQIQQTFDTIARRAFEIFDGSGRSLGQGAGVAGQKRRALAQADDERAAEAGADDHAGEARADDRQAVGALEAGTGRADRQPGLPAAPGGTSPSSMGSTPGAGSSGSAPAGAWMALLIELGLGVWALYALLLAGSAWRSSSFVSLLERPG